MEPQKNNQNSQQANSQTGGQQPTPPSEGSQFGGGMPPAGMPMGTQMGGQQPGQPPAGMPMGGQQGGQPPAGGQFGGGMPPAGMPMGGQQGGQSPGQPMGAPPTPPLEDNTPANFQLGTKLPQELKVKVPSNNLSFNEPHFIRLLAGSISLSKDEKKKIVESVPKLKQSQIDELIRIFEEEKQKFAALSKKHVPQLEKLAQQHYLEWMELEDEVEKAKKQQEDQSKADEIRKNLGL